MQATITLMHLAEIAILLKRSASDAPIPDKIFKEVKRVLDGYSELLTSFSENTSGRLDLDDLQHVQAVLESIRSGGPAHARGSQIVALANQAHQNSLQEYNLYQRCELLGRLFLTDLNQFYSDHLLSGAKTLTSSEA